VAQAGSAYWIGAQWICAGTKNGSLAVAILAVRTELMKEEAGFFGAADITQTHAGNSCEIFRTLAATIGFKKGVSVKCDSTLLLKIHQQVGFTLPDKASSGDNNVKRATHLQYLTITAPVGPTPGGLFLDSQANLLV